MSDATKNMIYRVVTHVVVLIGLYILQAMVFPRLRILGTAPLIIPIAVVGVGIFEGPSWGGGFGVAAGALCDMAFSDTTVLFTILLTAIGLGAGLLSSYLMTRGFPTYLLCTVAALVIIAFFQMFAYLVYDRVWPLLLMRVAVLQSLYSLVFMLPIYYLSRYLGRQARM